jgi:hypothetical protein
MPDRRELLGLILGGGVALSGTAAVARVGAGAAAPARAPGSAPRMWARLVADLSGRPVYFFTHGAVWGFKPQADDLALKDFARRIYGYSGVAARRVVRDAAGNLTLQQKAWGFYRDPLTDAITDRIANPYTGRVDRAPPLSGKISSRPLGANPAVEDPLQLRVRRMGATAIVETNSLARFKSADIDWYKLEANLENFACRAADLDSDAPHVPSVYSQNLVAEWQTWTGMHGTPGHILFKGDGVPLRSIGEVPADQIAAIERFFPGSLKDIAGW